MGFLTSSKNYVETSLVLSIIPLRVVRPSTLLSFEYSTSYGSLVLVSGFSISFQNFKGSFYYCSLSSSDMMVDLIY